MAQMLWAFFVMSPMLGSVGSAYDYIYCLAHCLSHLKAREAFSFEDIRIAELCTSFWVVRDISTGCPDPMFLALS